MKNNEIVERLKQIHPNLVKVEVHHDYYQRRTDFLWVFADGDSLAQQESWFGEPLDDETFLNEIHRFFISRGK